MLMSKIKEKIKLTDIEALFLIVATSIVILGGLLIFSSSTKNQEITNFKDDVKSLVSLSKNAYLNISENNSDLIINSSDGTTKGLCITIDGLKKNDFLTKGYDDWDGYIVIEENISNNKLTYSAWLTNKEYSLDGYEEELIADLKLDEGITKYNNELFSTKVRQNFTGTSSDKGGTGNAGGTKLKQYDAKCLNDKIEQTTNNEENE